VTAFVSYADAVQDLVYKNMSETIFLSPWPKQQDGTPQVDMHFGATGHQVITWALAFAAIDAAVDYCAGAAHSADAAEGGRVEAGGALSLPLTSELLLLLHDGWWRAVEGAVEGRHKR